MPSKTKLQRLEHIQNKQRALLIHNSVINSPLEAAGKINFKVFKYFSAIFQTSESRVLYWLRKFVDTSFHPLSHGGKQREKFDKVTRNFIRTILWDTFTKFPLGNVAFFTNELVELGFPVNYNDIRAIFQSWKWSWKGKINSIGTNCLVPAVQQLQKFTSRNMEDYFSYAIEIQKLPMEKLKFLDEAHFVPSHLLKGKFI